MILICFEGFGFQKYPEAYLVGRVRKQNSFHVFHIASSIRTKFSFCQNLTNGYLNVFPIFHFFFDFRFLWICFFSWTFHGDNKKRGNRDFFFKYSISGRASSALKGLVMLGRFKLGYFLTTLLTK